MDQARKINYKPATTSKGFPKNSLKISGGDSGIMRVKTVILRENKSYTIGGNIVMRNKNKLVE